MVLPLPKRACVLLCLLALAAALSVSLHKLWVGRSEGVPRSGAVSGLRVAPRNGAATEGQTRERPLPPNGYCWGSALNSAQSDGVGFFDRKRARAFIAEVDPEVQKYIVDLNARAFLPLPGPQHLAEAVPDKAAKHIVYLQFLDHPAPQERAQLHAAGVELLSYVTGYAWLARGTGEAFGAALEFAFVRAVAQVDPRDKLNEQVFQGETPPHARTAAGQARLWLIAQPGTSAAALAAQLATAPPLAALEARALYPSVLGPRFEIVAEVALAPRIAALDSAAFLEFAPPPAASRDATTDVESNIGQVRDNPPNLDGSGVTVAVRELGAISLHVDFANRLQAIDTNGATSSVEVDHATAVTGQIGSSGASRPAAKGVAPAVSMLAYVVGADPETFATTDILDAASRGVRVSNHSYGPANALPSDFGAYESISADWDGALSSSNLLGMFATAEAASGNQYFQTDYFVGAKNTVCVGASSAAARAGDPNANPPIAAADGIAYFSQFGPMNDGRIKPDLVAFGDNVTLDQDTNSTQVNTGTSFATPVVTGVAALAFQAYKAAAKTEPTAQLAKALLCNSATDLGPPGPDAQYGFGLVNAQAAIATVALFASGGSPFYESTVSNGTKATFTVNVQNTSVLKATLCWLDPAGNPSAAKALVNDLDLEVVEPNGTTIHYPYSVDPINYTAPASNSGPNRVDPIEQTVVTGPANGLWTINVKGTSIPSGAQPFAVCLNIPAQPLGLSAFITAKPLVGGVPLPVVFSGQFSTGSIVSYAWNFGDGATGQGQNISHTFASQGTYTVTLTVTGADGTTASSSVTIVASAPAILASPSSGPAPLLVSFAPLNPSNSLIYLWTFGDGTGQVQGADVQHTYQAAGSYTVTLTVVNQQHNQVAASPVVINVNRSVLQAYPSRARVRFNFSKGQDDLQCLMTVPQLVLTPQQSRDAVRDGTFEGNTYTVLLNSVPVPDLSVILDRRATFRTANASFKLNLVRGEIIVNLKAGSATNMNPLAKSLGVSNNTGALPSLPMIIEVTGSSTVYRAVFNLSYKSNRKTGNGTSF